MTHERKPLGETVEEYVSNAKEYFRNVEGPKSRDQLSASDREEIEKHLPNESDKHKILDRFERGFTKTSRSGAFSKAGAGPAIFPNGLKFASDFVDQMTPKRPKPQEAMKPLREATRQVEAPPAAAIIADRCVDCMEPISIGQSELVMFMMICTEGDTHKLQAMGVQFADAILGIVHGKCAEAAQNEARNVTPLVLVFGGCLPSDEDVRIAERYGFSLNLHDGQEKTLGQWKMLIRRDRMETNVSDYLINADKHGPVFRINRKPNG